MQAGAMGLPSIVSDINGCNEIVENGYNGFIIPVQNQEKLHEKMFFLLQNSEKRTEIANNSRKKIVENYERNYIWSEILKEYKNLTVLKET